MSEIGTQMLLELQRIREALEGEGALGFGKHKQPTFVFIGHKDGSLWYFRDQTKDQTIPIPERNLTGYVRGVWRVERDDPKSPAPVSKLRIHMHAGKDYILQSGFDTNFSKSFLSALLELPKDALDEPLTLLLEDNSGGHGRPSVFARLIHRGTRIQAKFSKNSDPAALLEAVGERFALAQRDES